MRKPPQADVDSFIAAGAEAVQPRETRKSTVVVKPANAQLDEVITRPDGRAFRELTLYLPNDLARRLSLHCMESDRDMSNVMAEIVKERLDGPPPPPPIAAPRQSLFSSNIQMGREIAMSLWRIRPWAH